jgi:chemotaxis protein CheX
MRLDYITPIVESAVSILTGFTGAPVAYGEMQLQRFSAASRDIVVVVGVSGEVAGRVVLEMDKAEAVALAGMMNHEKISTVTPLAQDTLMELGNMVVAKAVSTLNDRGFEFSLSPPAVYTEENRSLFVAIDLETLVVPLTVAGIAMNLSFALRMHPL